MNKRIFPLEEDELCSEYDKNGNWLYRIPRAERFGIPSKETLKRMEEYKENNPHVSFKVIYGLER